MTITQTVSIRTMTLDDIDQVLHVENSSFNKPWTRVGFENELLNNRFATYFIVEDNDQVIGYCGVWIIIDEAHITNIAILPEYRGKKIGETLLKKAMLYASMARTKTMSLEVRVSNNTALGLYRKLGFKNGGIRKRYYTDNHEDALVMWAVL